jgi:hypothetical protein
VRVILSRRKFVHSSLFAGAGLMLGPRGENLIPDEPSMFGIHPFILQNPESVFIMKTNIDRKTNSAAIRSAGLDFGRSVFGFSDDPDTGIPLSHRVVIKPNLTCRQRGRDIYTVENSMGIVTDAFFVEGIIESLKELTIPSDRFHIREVNCPDDLADGGYLDMASRTGIDLQCIDTPALSLSPDKIQWVDVPDGVWFRKIPYLWPVNAPDTFLLNVAKFKAHGMGLTLCAKNLQGTNAMNYQAHCTAYGTMMQGVSSSHISSSANEDILANYNRHVAYGIPRWNRPGEDGGLWQETWATRCLDNNSVTSAGLHIIEGIYGRDGNFLDGPGLNNLATDYMTNYIIFGRNQFCVDVVGHYLGGHEPGNFGLFHMALERGMVPTINPMNISVYEWSTASGPAPADIGSFQRYPLKTYYLQRNYDGQSEPYWHLVNEPFNYKITSAEPLPGDHVNFSLNSISPNPARNSATLAFHIPRSGYASVEVLNNNGRIIERLLDENLNPGDHTVIWDCRNQSPGLYFCRIRFGNTFRIGKLMVTR